MKYFLTFFILFVAAQMSFSQISKHQTTVATGLVDTKPQTAQTTNLRPINLAPKEGTYQIIVQDASSPNVVPIISDEILYQIDSERKPDEEVFLYVNEYVRIKILPYSAIQSNNFQPIEKYKYEN